jgi:hypothetical protein
MTCAFLITGCCKEYHPSHAIISAACALEALKLVSGCNRSVSNYLMVSFAASCLRKLRMVM